jgi:hypothetical protein
MIDYNKHANKIIERFNYKGITCCGHDFNGDDSIGTVKLCIRCHQFFIKAKGDPVIEKYSKDGNQKFIFHNHYVYIKVNIKNVNYF